MSKIILKNVRCVYPELAAPKSFKMADGNETAAKYSIQLLIPKTDKAQIAALKDMIKKSIDAAKISAGIKKQIVKTAFDLDPYNDNSAIKDGDEKNKRRAEEEKDEYDYLKGMFVISAKRSPKIGPPLVVGPDAKEIPQEKVAGEIIGGYYVNVEVSDYVYTKPKAGFTFNLNAVQLVKKGERFGQANPFEEVEETDETDPEGAFGDSEEE